MPATVGSAGDPDEFDEYRPAVGRCTRRAYLRSKIARVSPIAWIESIALTLSVLRVLAGRDGGSAARTTLARRTAGRLGAARLLAGGPRLQPKGPVVMVPRQVEAAPKPGEPRLAA